MNEWNELVNETLVKKGGLGISTEEISVVMDGKSKLMPSLESCGQCVRSIDSADPCSSMKGSWEQKQSLGSEAAHKYKFVFRIEMVKQAIRWGTSSLAVSKISEWLFDFCC